MARPGGNPTLRGCGKKGRSGRKSAPVEFAKAQAIIKAWNKVNNELESCDVKDIALPIVLKTMTGRYDLTSGGEIIGIYSAEQIDNIARRRISANKL